MSKRILPEDYENLVKGGEIVKQLMKEKRWGWKFKDDDVCEFFFPEKGLILRREERSEEWVAMEKFSVHQKDNDLLIASGIYVIGASGDPFKKGDKRLKRLFDQLEKKMEKKLKKFAREWHPGME